MTGAEARQRARDAAADAVAPREAVSCRGLFTEAKTFTCPECGEDSPTFGTGGARAQHRYKIHGVPFAYTRRVVEPRP